MNIVIAAHAFEDDLTAPQVCAAIKRGFAYVMPHVHYTLVPMANGGEGTSMALVAARGGEWVQVRVSDPLGRTVLAKYGVLPDGTAVMDMSEAIGWHLLTPAERNPMKVSSYGVGEMIADALNRGVRQMILGVGRGAAFDGGAGMAQALGFRLRDKAGRELPRGGAALRYLANIDDSGSLSALQGCTIVAASEVAMPAYDAGVNRPKGAHLPMVRELENALNNFTDVLARQYKINVRDEVGNGTAGGLGLGLRALLGAQLRSGMEIVLEATGLAHKMALADLVITGQGVMDGQMALDSVPVHVLNVARKHGIPVIGLAGQVVEGEKLYDLGFAAVLPSVHRHEQAEEQLIATARAVAAIWAL